MTASCALSPVQKQGHSGVPGNDPVHELCPFALSVRQLSSSGLGLNPEAWWVAQNQGPQWGPRGGGARGRAEGSGRWRGIDPIIPFTGGPGLQTHVIAPPQSCLSLPELRCGGRCFACAGANQ